MNNPFAGLDSITPESSAPTPSAPPLPAPPMPTSSPPGQLPTEPHWKPSLPDQPPPSKKWLWWAISGAIVLGLIGGGYFAYTRGWIQLPFQEKKAGLANTNASKKTSSQEPCSTAATPFDGFLDRETLSPGERCFEIQYLQLLGIIPDLETFKSGISPISGAGRYPKTLDEIRLEFERKKIACDEAERQRKAEQGLIGLGYPCVSYASLLEHLNFTDVYTQQPFRYEGTANDYQLTFVMRYYDGIDELSKQQFKDGDNTFNAQAARSFLKGDLSQDTIAATRDSNDVETVERLLLEQEGRVQNLKIGLAVYKSGRGGGKGKGVFPNSLDELLTGIKEMYDSCLRDYPNQSINGPIESSCITIEPFIFTEDDLTDVFTGQRYPYQRQDDNYTLTYQMRLIEGVNSRWTDDFANGTNTMTSGDASLEKKESKYEDVTSVNLNTNTNSNANENVNSSDNSSADSLPSLLTEGAKAGCYLNLHPDALTLFPEFLRQDFVGYTTNSQPYCSTYSQTDVDAVGRKLSVDTDQDGLNLFIEESFKSSDAKVDTDGDGYNDAQEIENGYNPNGTGELIDALE